MPKGDDTNLWVHLPVAVMVNYIIFVELFTYTGMWYYNMSDIVVWYLYFEHMQVFVEALDKCFENVCELDLIFHVDKVHNILQEICMGGMVVETSQAEILSHVEAQSKLEKSESNVSGVVKVL